MTGGSDLALITAERPWEGWDREFRPPDFRDRVCSGVNHLRDWRSTGNPHAAFQRAFWKLQKTNDPHQRENLQETKEAIDKAMAVLVLPNMRYTPGDQGDQGTVWEEEEDWIPMIDPYALGGQDHHSTNDIIIPGGTTVPIWAGPQPWCWGCAGSHIRGARPEVHDQHLKSDDEDAIYLVNAEGPANHTIDEALALLRNKGMENPPVKEKVRAAFCSQCGYYREQWSLSMGCACFRRCNQCVAPLCDSCCCMAPGCTEPGPTRQCKVNPQGAWEWCKECVNFCECTAEGRMKCTHPHDPENCSCPRKLGRWLSLQDINQGNQPLCPGNHTWRKNRDSRNRHSDVKWTISEGIRPGTRTQNRPQVQPQEKGGPSQTGQQPPQESTNQSDERTDKLWAAIRRALASDEHGMPQSTEAMTREAEKLMLPGAQLQPWEQRRREALERAVKDS
jgi:hypothetical protein